MTESQFPSDLDMSEWAPEDRLEFYRQYFFERCSAVAIFDELPVDHRLHVVRRCLADMAALGWRERSLGLIEDMARELERIEGGSNGGANNPALKAVLRGLATAELLFVGGAERAAIPPDHFEPEALQPTLERVNDKIRAIVRECPLGGVYAADEGVEIALCYEPDGGISVTYRVPFRSRRGYRLDVADLPTDFACTMAGARSRPM